MNWRPTNAIDMVMLLVSMSALSMISEAPANTVRQHLEELLNEVQYRRQRVVITRAGKPVAALVDTAAFDRLRRLDEEFEHLRGKLGEGFSRYSEDEVDALVDEAVEAARANSIRE